MEFSVKSASFSKSHWPSAFGLKLGSYCAKRAALAPARKASVEGSRFVSWLASQERKAFHWMASHKPDLVIKLNVDLDVACARKPDHKRESLARKIAITPQLTFGGAQLVDIDANQPLEQVLVDAEKAITDFMTARGYH